MDSPANRGIRWPQAVFINFRGGEGVNNCLSVEVCIAGLCNYLQYVVEVLYLLASRQQFNSKATGWSRHLCHMLNQNKKTTKQMNLSEMVSHYPQLTSTSLITLNLAPKWRWPWLVILTQILPRFSPIYVSTEQKAHICNSFQLIVQTDTDTHVHHICMCPW